MPYSITFGFVLMDSVAQLKKQIEELKIQLANQKVQVDQYQQAYQHIKHQLDELIRYRFGKRSERYADPNSPQSDMFSETDLPEVETPPAEEEQVEVPAHKRRKKPKRDWSQFLREIIIIPVSDEDKVCACGCQKKVIGYEKKELLDYQPAECRVVEERREIVACGKGCEGQVKTAPATAHVLPKVKATESLLANIIVSKLHHRQPLYHLEKYCVMAGLSRETMARWMIQLKEPLQPIFNLMKEAAIDHDVASIDATTLQVLKEPGRRAETKSYLYCIRGGPPDKSVVLYAYNALEHKKFVDEWFGDYKGYVHMDADQFFERLIADDDVNEVYCNAHARRKFESVMKHAKKQGLSHEAVRFYKKLYKIERKAKDNNMSAEERYQFRLDESKPVLDEYESWLKQYRPALLQESPLCKAFDYTINHWDGLIRFLEDGRLEIDNNLTEQEIKPAVIARKNFMFANSVDGAHALAFHLSFIRTALAHGHSPYTYYVHLLKRIPLCKCVEDFENLLPWNVELASAKQLSLD